MPLVDDRPVARERRAGHRRDEFPDVPGPRVVGEPAEGRAAELPRVGRQAVHRALLGQEHAGQQRNVLGPLLQRGQPDREGVDPVVEIFAEPFLAHQQLERAVGGRHEPEVHVDAGAAAQPLHLALLEDAQQLRLRHERQVADLVEEQRAAVGQLDPPEPPLVRAGEGSLLVAEDLGLEQRIGNGRAADGLERPRLPTAQVVNGAGGHFLAGARGPEDQHRDVGLGRGADRLEHQQHLLVAADQLEELAAPTPARCGRSPGRAPPGSWRAGGPRSRRPVAPRRSGAGRSPHRRATPALISESRHRSASPRMQPVAAHQRSRCRTSRHGARGGTAAARRGAATRPASETAGPKARQAPRWSQMKAVRRQKRP